MQQSFNALECLNYAIVLKTVEVDAIEIRMAITSR